MSLEALHAAEMEAKREVAFLAGCGRMITPREAWALTGQEVKADTLWSVAYRIGTTRDVPPEDINAYLEKQFPGLSMSGGHPHHWDDHHRHSG